tara:strand:+ start:1827 stop:2198 length:372 start_codon:yes stop_codon:yes gene_type:complete
MDTLQTTNHKSYIYIIIAVLLLISLYSFFRFISIRSDLVTLQNEVVQQETNESIIGFTNLFIEQVLQTESEIDFESRLELENTVREIEDEEILEVWRAFVESRTEQEAQDNVVTLLIILINKI